MLVQDRDGSSGDAGPPVGRFDGDGERQLDERPDEQVVRVVERRSPLGYRVVSRERAVDAQSLASGSHEWAGRTGGPDAPDLTVLTLAIEAPSGLDAAGRRTLAHGALQRLGATETPRSLVGDQVLVVQDMALGACAVLIGSPEQFESVTAAVVLAALQRDHLARMDAALTTLRSQALVDVEHAPGPSLATLRERRRLDAAARRIKRLALHHEAARGAFANAWRYVDGPIAVPLYAAVAGMWHLESWFDEQDDALETYNDLYDAITEKLSEARNVVVEVVLEATIIVVLLVELALLAIDLYQ